MYQQGGLLYLYIYAFVHLSDLPEVILKLEKLDLVSTSVERNTHFPKKEVKGRKRNEDIRFHSPPLRNFHLKA